MFMCFFFFKQKTAYEMRISDWSSDVCSSDLRVQAVLRTRELLARELQRAQEPLHRQNGSTAAPQFGVEEAHVERAVVDDQRCAADEVQELVADRLEQRFVGQEILGQPVDLVGLVRHEIGRESCRERVCQKV